MLSKSRMGGHQYLHPSMLADQRPVAATTGGVVPAPPYDVEPHGHTHREHSRPEPGMRVTGDWPGHLVLRQGWAKAEARPWNRDIPDAALRLVRGSADFLASCSAYLLDLGVSGVASPPLPEISAGMWLTAGFEPHLALDLYSRELVGSQPEPFHEVTTRASSEWELHRANRPRRFSSTLETRSRWSAQRRWEPPLTRASSSLSRRAARPVSPSSEQDQSPATSRGWPSIRTSPGKVSADRWSGPPINGPNVAGLAR